MIIANHMINFSDLNQLWMVVSPHNPFKKKSSLANDYDRLHLVHLAIAGNPNIQASNIEFSLPKPSFTIDTLTYLKEKYPNYEFALIMGGDNLATFHKWKNFEKILEHHDVLVYQRPEYELGALENHPRISIVDAPMLNISSSFIRELIKKGKSVQYLVPHSVFEYIDVNNMYK
jgi:nicotinate-nucleotide adenylyltransferase